MKSKKRATTQDPNEEEPFTKNTQPELEFSKIQHDLKNPLH